MLLNSHRLRNLVDGAFDWIIHNLELFNPFSGETDGIDPDAYGTKALCELILMCMLYRQCMKESPDSRVLNFISFAQNIWQRPDYQERGARNLETFRAYAMIYINLLRADAVDRSYCEIIQRILDQGYVTAVELVPSRVMEFRHTLDSVGFKHNLPSYEDLYQTSTLAQTPPLVYFTNGDAYAVTHTLFYLTDFSLRPITTIPEQQLPTICWMVSTLLGIYLRERDWDIVGELLLNCRGLQWAPPFLFENAWDCLLNVQFPDGSIPGPKFSKEEMQRLNELEQRSYCFKQNYHTTLVAAMTGFLSEHWIASL